MAYLEITYRGLHCTPWIPATPPHTIMVRIPWWRRAAFLQLPPVLTHDHIHRLPKPLQAIATTNCDTTCFTRYAVEDDSRLVHPHYNVVMSVTRVSRSSRTMLWAPEDPLPNLRYRVQRLHERVRTGTEMSQVVADPLTQLLDELDEYRARCTLSESEYGPLCTEIQTWLEPKHREQALQQLRIRAITDLNRISRYITEEPR